MYNTIEEYLDSEEEIECPYCEEVILVCDLDELPLMLVNQEIIQECPHCHAEFYVNSRFKVKKLHRCAYCQDEGYVYEDAFEPTNGHYEIKRTCECQNRRI